MARGYLTTVNESKFNNFRKDMDKIVELCQTQTIPPKVRRFIRMYECGLPLDTTVRYYPASKFDEIEQRVKELITGGKEVWVSIALPEEASEASVQTPPRIPPITSLEIYHQQAIHMIQALPPNSWVKVYFETFREMTCIVIRISNDPSVDRREVLVEVWFHEYDLKEAVKRIPDWRLFCGSETNFFWKLQDNADLKKAHFSLLKKIFGYDGRHRHAVARIANIEKCRTIAFEFKALPASNFFIDYERIGPRDPRHTFDWLYYLRHGE